MAQGWLWLCITSLYVCKAAEDRAAWFLSSYSHYLLIIKNRAHCVRAAKGCCFAAFGCDPSSSLLCFIAVSEYHMQIKLWLTCTGLLRFIEELSWRQDAESLHTNRDMNSHTHIHLMFFLHIYVNSIDLYYGHIKTLRPLNVGVWVRLTKWPSLIPLCLFCVCVCVWVWVWAGWRAVRQSVSVSGAFCWALLCAVWDVLCDKRNWDGPEVMLHLKAWILNTPEQYICFVTGLLMREVGMKSCNSHFKRC